MSVFRPAVTKGLTFVSRAKVQYKKGEFYLDLFLLPGLGVVKIGELPMKDLLYREENFEKCQRLGSKIKLLQIPLNIQPNKTQLKLIEMASHSSISATSFTVQVVDQPLKCFTVHSPQYRVGLDQKLYFAAYINRQRIMACIDSGSDLT